MIGWDQAFSASVLLLWLIASPRDRMALRIVLIAAGMAEIMKYSGTIHIHGSWKLIAFNGVGEAITLLALLKWAPNRTGYKQAACVAIALAAHLICYVDIEMGTNLVFDRYMAIIQTVAILQLLAFHDTIGFNFHRARCWLELLRPRNMDPVRAGSMRTSVLHEKNSPRLQTLPEPRQAD